MTLKDDDEKPIDILMMGAEGCIPKPATPGISSGQLQTPGHIDRSQIWLAGKLDSSFRGDDSVPQMRPEFGGIVDHGCFYAAATFWDPLEKVRIIWGGLQRKIFPTTYDSGKIGVDSCLCHASSKCRPFSEF